jgi:hypothetical protein
MEELTAAKFAAHVAAGEVLVKRGAGDAPAIALIVADVAPAEDSALRFAVLAGDPGAAFELLEQCRALAAEAIRFRYAEDSPLVSAVDHQYRRAGYHFPEWSLHVLARPLGEGHEPPEIDPDVLTLEDVPGPL